MHEEQFAPNHFVEATQRAQYLRVGTLEVGGLLGGSWSPWPMESKKSICASRDIADRQTDRLLEAGSGDCDSKG